MSNVVKQLSITVLGLLLVGCTDDPVEVQQDVSSAQVERTVAPAEVVGPAPVAEVTQGAARAAVAAGTLSLVQYPPLPSPPGHGEYLRLLKDRCGVNYQNVKPPAGIDKQDFIKQVNVWNEIMRAEIKQTFGDDIFEQLGAEAKQLWKASLAAPKKPAGK